MVTVPRDRGAEARVTLEAALTRSGLSLRAFAERVVSRDERTVRRWRSGDAPIPEHADEWLRQYVAGRVRVSGRWLTE